MAEYDLLIVNGVVVTDEEEGELDIAVKDGKIDSVLPRGGFGGAKAERVIDAEGGYVMPGEWSWKLWQSGVANVVPRRCRCACALGGAAVVWKWFYGGHVRDR